MQQASAAWFCVARPFRHIHVLDSNEPAEACYHVAALDTTKEFSLTKAAKHVCPEIRLNSRGVLVTAHGCEIHAHVRRNREQLPRLSTRVHEVCDPRNCCVVASVATHSPC